MAKDESTHHSAARRLAGSLSLYTLARSAAGAVRLLTVPFIVHAVSAKAYGTLATLWVPLVVVHGVCDLGIGTAAIRLASECPDPPARRSLFATMISTRALVGFLVTGIVLAIHEPLARWMTGSSDDAGAFFWLAATRPLAMVFDALLDDLRARDAMPTVSLLVFLLTVVVQGLTVAFALGLGLELDGLIWGRVLGELVAFVAGAALCARFVWARPSAAYLSRLLGFGWPFGVVLTLGTLRGFDRAFIRSLTSIEHVAAYELAARLVGPIGVFNIALGIVFEPFVYARSQSSETPGFVDVFVRSYVAVFAALAMAMSVVAPEAVRLLAPAPYHEASRVLPALLFSTACEGLQRAAGVGADLAKQTRVWAAASTLTLVIGLGLVFLLVPRLGIAGVGVSWVFANVSATLLVYRVARAVSGIVLPVGAGLLVLMGGALLGTAAAWQPWPILARLGVLVAFGLVAHHVMRARWRDVLALFVARR